MKKAALRSLGFIFCLLCSALANTAPNLPLVSQLEVQNVNGADRYAIDGSVLTPDAFTIYTETEYTITNVPEEHAIALVYLPQTFMLSNPCNQTIDGILKIDDPVTTFQYYYGPVKFTMSSECAGQVMMIVCYSHPLMTVQEVFAIVANQTQTTSAAPSIAPSSEPASGSNSSVSPISSSPTHSPTLPPTQAPTFHWNEPNSRTRLFGEIIFALLDNRFQQYFQANKVASSNPILQDTTIDVNASLIRMSYALSENLGNGDSDNWKYLKCELICTNLNHDAFLSDTAAQDVFKQTLINVMPSVTSLTRVYSYHAVPWPIWSGPTDINGSQTNVLFRIQINQDTTSDESDNMALYILMGVGIASVGCILIVALWIYKKPPYTQLP